MEETEHRPVVIETEPKPETEAQEPVKGNVIQQRTETDGMIHSYLTGELVPAEQGKRRPLAVMMSNDRAALPQYGPVSYTHLDVYKRQGWRSWIVR